MGLLKYVQQKFQVFWSKGLQIIVMSIPGTYSKEHTYFFFVVACSIIEYQATYNYSIHILLNRWVTLLCRTIDSLKKSVILKLRATSSKTQLEKNWLRIESQQEIIFIFHIFLVDSIIENHIYNICNNKVNKKKKEY